MVETQGDLVIVEKKYKFDKRKAIAEGSYGKVHMASTLQEVPTACAVKIIESSKLPPGTDYQDFYREIKEQMKFEHSNVLRILDAYEFDKGGTKTLYIFTEYCKGGSLRDLLNDLKKNKEELDDYFIIDFLRQILTGFRHIHRRLKAQGLKMVHRDLKPDNILVDKFVFKIADFGSVKVSKEHEEIFASKIGTEKYMAPEIEKDKRLEQSCDVYGLGLIAYELMYKELPKLLKLRDDVEELVFPDDSKWGQPLKKLVSQMVRKNPVSRISFEKLFTHPLLFLKASGESQKIFKDMLNLMENNSFHVVSPFTTSEDESPKAMTMSFISFGKSGENLGEKFLRNSWASFSPAESIMAKRFDDSPELKSDKVLKSSLLIENISDLFLIQIFKAFSFLHLSYLFNEVAYRDLMDLKNCLYYELIYCFLVLAKKTLKSINEQAEFLKSKQVHSENISSFLKSQKSGELKEQIDSLLKRAKEFDAGVQSMIIENGIFEDNFILSEISNLESDASEKTILKDIITSVLSKQKDKNEAKIREREHLVILYYLYLIAEQKFDLDTYLDSLKNPKGGSPSMKIPNFLNEVNMKSREDLVEAIKKFKR